MHKLKGREVALDAISRLLQGINLCAVETRVIQQALYLNLHDFEDGVQLAYAVSEGLDAVVTRDANDFRNVNFTVLSTAHIVDQFTLAE